MTVREQGLNIASSTTDSASLTFSRLIDAHLTGAYRLATVLLGNGPDAEDAIQEAATVAWRSFGTLRDVDRFNAWFDRILVNHCRDRLRRGGRIRFIQIAHAPEPTEVDRSGHLAERDALASALEKLPAAQRVAVVLRYLDDMSIEEIAALTGERAGTIKSRLHYGLAALRAAYEAAGRIQEDER